MADPDGMHAAIMEPAGGGMSVGGSIAGAAAKTTSSLKTVAAVALAPVVLVIAITNDAIGKIKSTLLSSNSDVTPKS
jgi:hypothetical protein